jgi:hypothetical protein
MKNDFLKTNLLVTCSGGETSMTVTLYCLEHLRREYNICVVFANTGVESNKTLDYLYKCQKEFNIPINWIEAKVYHNQRKSCGYKNVKYFTATRNTDWRKRDNTPFEEVVKKYGLPNHSRLHCTRELKMNPIKAFAKDYFNGEDYILALGIRVDEIDRINPKYKELGIIYPLAQSEYKPMTKKQVNFFWDLQPFRLELKGYEGNCLTCYKKSNNKLLMIAKENPEAFEFFNYLENKYGNPKGKIPQKIEHTYWDEDLNEEITSWELETLPKEEYKNVIFRDFRTAKDIIEEAKNFNGNVIDDHIETESCEIFSNCGE